MPHQRGCHASQEGGEEAQGGLWATGRGAAGGAWLFPLLKPLRELQGWPRGPGAVRGLQGRRGRRGGRAGGREKAGEPRCDRSAASSWAPACGSEATLGNLFSYNSEKETSSWAGKVSGPEPHSQPAALPRLQSQM